MATRMDVCTAAEHPNSQSQIKSSNNYVKENFESFSKCNDFLGLPFSCLKEVISQDDLKVSSEEIVFEAVLKWVKTSPSERRVMLPELLSEVRMVHLPPDYLENRINSEPLVTESDPCRNLVEEAKRYHLMPKDGSQSVVSFKTVPRNYGSTAHGLFAVCKAHSSQHSSSLSFNSYDPTTEEWKCLASAQVQRGSNVLQVTAVNDKLFIFLDEKIGTFHLKSLRWELLEIEHQRTGGAAVVPHENVIYCFGSGHECASDKVRRFDTQQCKWLEEKRMQTNKCYSAAACLNKYIYLTGGYSGSTNLDSVEKYNPSTDEWSKMASMLTPRFGHRCAEVNGKILACGGFDKIAPLRTAEMYDPVANQWNFVSPMKTARQFFSLVTYDQKIHVFSGVTEGYELTSDAEIYDPDGDQWKPGLRAPQGFEFVIAIPAARY